MSEVLPLLIGGAIGLFFLDRVLRWMEDRGWIYYRKTKPGRSAVAYHLFEMSSAFDPSFEVVQEIQVQEEQTQDESGEPVGLSPAGAEAGEEPR